jgi:SAM-dependent methyltransferase
MADLQTKYADIGEFPGWDKAGDFIKGVIKSNGFKVIGDIGGGRLPRVGLDFIQQHGLSYNLFDIAADELAQADNAYQKIVMDVACNDSVFNSLNVRTDFDMIYSHMLLEHLTDPLQAHRNIFRMLRPGGLSVHMFPSRNNFPLFINGFIPESVSHKLLKIVQPHRNTTGQEGKFKAYYKLCGAPNDAHRRLYESIGFEVVKHTSFVGHDYYKRVPPLAAAERGMRKLIIKAGLPLINATLLILRKSLVN